MNNLLIRNQLAEIVEDIQPVIKENDYLKMMNLLVKMNVNDISNPNYWRDNYELRNQNETLHQENEELRFLIKPVTFKDSCISSIVIFIGTSLIRYLLNNIYVLLQAIILLLS